MREKAGIGGMAARMAGFRPSFDVLDEEVESKTNNTIVKPNIVDPNDVNKFSGTNVLEGFKKYYDYVDQTGLLNEEKVNETKENLLNIAEENKNNNSGSKKDTTSTDDSKLISFNFENLDPRTDIFNYNPRGNIGFNIGNEDEGFFTKGDVDASRSGLNTDFQAGFKNDNINVGYNLDRGLNYDFTKQFGDKTNLGINQSGVQFGSQLGENTNVDLAYNNGNFDPSLKTNIKDTNLTINPKEFLLNKTFQLGEGDLTLSGRVGFDGQTTGQIDYDREIGPGKLNIFYNPNDAGFNYNFLNRKF